MKNLYVAFIMSAFSLICCQTKKNIVVLDTTMEGSANPSLLETDWKLVALNGRTVVNPIPNQKVASIKLLQEGNRLVGSGGCNTLMGSFELLDKNHLAFSGVAMTRMACPDMSIEQELSQAFKATNMYSIEGKYLMLTKGKKVTLAKFEAQE